MLFFTIIIITCIIPVEVFLGIMLLIVTSRFTIWVTYTDRFVLF
jgi:hypothetical protein